MPEIMNSQEWRKFKENQESQKNDRPTFSTKCLQKWGKSALIEYENSGNTVVVPYLWGIETCIRYIIKPNQRFQMLYLTYEELKHYFPGTFILFFLRTKGCTLPMRNWNDIRETNMPATIWLYLTYEELKHHKTLF